MPTYEYACTSCGHHLEIFQSFSDEPLTTCPSCGGQLRKVFGAVGIVLKGSGFYRTDSRSNGARAASRSDKDKKERSGDTAAAATSSSSSSSRSWSISISRTRMIRWRR